MSSTQHRASRCVFVGNIPYDATEEQLVHICEDVGPVVSFRLVLDRETGKPKGYGFCEFRDEETALSARRNLQGYEINGRQLRVDFAENEKGGGNERNREQRQGGQGLPSTGYSSEAQRQAGSGQTGGIIEGERSGDPPIGQSVATAAARFLSGALGGNQQQYGVSMNGHSMPVANGSASAAGNDVLTNQLAGMSKHQLYEVMLQMKALIQQNQQQGRQVLMANPQLTKALFQAQIMLGMVRAPQMNQMQPPVLAAQSQQPQRPPVPAPTNLMQQPPLPPQPRPVAVPPPGIQSQIQQTNPAQPINYQPTQLQQQSIPQPPYQHQGGMLQPSSGMAMAYSQQGVPPPLQQQYQMMQPNVGRMAVDMGTGAPAMGQGSMVSGAEAIMPTGPPPVMGPGGIAQMGRGGGQANQAPSPSTGPASVMSSGVMHGIVLGAGNTNQAGSAVTGTPVSSSPVGIGAPPVADSNSRPSYVGLPGSGHIGPEAGMASAPPMQPHGYGQVPLPQPQLQISGELEQQKALLQQVLSLTPDQINSLPLDQRQQVLQLQQALRT